MGLRTVAIDGRLIFIIAAVAITTTSLAKDPHISRSAEPAHFVSTQA
jgi:hypothetical protein